ncbi:hypothetical protein Dimus_039311 [Dionaea muscipula]
MLGRRSLRPELIELNHNQGRRTKNPRSKKMKDPSPQIPNNLNGQNNGVNGVQNVENAGNGGNGVASPVNPFHTHFIRNVYDILSCIELPAISAANYEIKPDTIQSLPQFNGLSQEDPYNHLAEFLSISSTLKIVNFPANAMKLILFPFSL